MARSPPAASALPCFPAQEASQLALFHIQIGLSEASAAGGTVAAFSFACFQVRNDAARAKQVAARQLVQRVRGAVVEGLQLARAGVQHIRPDFADSCARGLCGRGVLCRAAFGNAPAAQHQVFRAARLADALVRCRRRH